MKRTSEGKESGKNYNVVESLGSFHSSTRITRKNCTVEWGNAGHLNVSNIV